MPSRLALPTVALLPKKSKNQSHQSRCFSVWMKRSSEALLAASSFLASASNLALSLFSFGRSSANFFWKRLVLPSSLFARFPTSVKSPSRINCFSSDISISMASAPFSKAFTVAGWMSPSSCLRASASSDWLTATTSDMISRKTITCPATFLKDLPYSLRIRSLMLFCTHTGWQFKWAWSSAESDSPSGPLFTGWRTSICARAMLVLWPVLRRMCWFAREPRSCGNWWIS